MDIVELSLDASSTDEIRHDALGLRVRPVAGIWPEPVAPPQIGEVTAARAERADDWLTGSPLTAHVGGWRGTRPHLHPHLGVTEP